MSEEERRDFYDIIVIQLSLLLQYFREARFATLKRANLATSKIELKKEEVFVDKFIFLMGILKSRQTLLYSDKAEIKYLMRESKGFPEDMFLLREIRAKFPAYDVDQLLPRSGAVLGQKSLESSSSVHIHSVDDLLKIYLICFKGKLELSAGNEVGQVLDVFQSPKVPISNQQGDIPDSEEEPVNVTGQDVDGLSSQQASISDQQGDIPDSEEEPVNVTGQDVDDSELQEGESSSRKKESLYQLVLVLVVLAFFVDQFIDGDSQIPGQRERGIPVAAVSIFSEVLKWAQHFLEDSFIAEVFSLELSGGSSSEMTATIGGEAITDLRALAQTIQSGNSSLSAEPELSASDVPSRSSADSITLNAVAIDQEAVITTSGSSYDVSDSPKVDELEESFEVFQAPSNQIINLVVRPFFGEEPNQEPDDGDDDQTTGVDVVDPTSEREGNQTTGVDVVDPTSEKEGDQTTGVDVVDTNQTTGVDVVDPTSEREGNQTTLDVEDNVSSGIGGQVIYEVTAGDVLVIEDFGGVGRGSNLSQDVIDEIDTIKVIGNGLTANNLQLFQNGDDLEIAFRGDTTGTKVVLRNFDLENLENLERKTGANVDHGNILFSDEVAFEDSFDVFNADSTQHHLWNLNSVTYLNNLDNQVDGFKNSNDIIMGMAGHDHLSSLSGDDLLDGGRGNDVYTGGKGADIFVFAEDEGTDTITDFEVGADQIALGSSLSINDIQLSESGNDTRVLMKSNGEVLGVIQGVTGLDDSIFG